MEKGTTLSRSAFLVLLALSDRARHGLGIIDDVEDRTCGRERMGPGTLYGTLKRLVELDMIEETEVPPDPDDHDPRRKYYRILPAGREAVAAEAETLRTLVAAAEGKDVLPAGG